MSSQQLLSANVKARMDDRGWTVANLAEAAGLSRPTVYTVLNMERDATFDTLNALADAFGCEPHELIAPNAAVRSSLEGVLNSA